MSRAWLPGHRTLAFARAAVPERRDGQRFCCSCGSTLRPDVVRGWCGVCVGASEIAVKALRLRLGEHWPQLPTRTLRALTDARLTPQQVRLLTDAEFLALPGLGPRALWTFRSYVSAPGSACCNWVGEGVPA